MVSLSFLLTSRKRECRSEIAINQFDQMPPFCCRITTSYSDFLQGVVKFDRRGDRETTIEILQQQGVLF